MTEKIDSLRSKETGRFLVKHGNITTTTTYRIVLTGTSRPMSLTPPVVYMFLWCRKTLSSLILGLGTRKTRDSTNFKSSHLRYKTIVPSKSFCFYVVVFVGFNYFIRHCQCICTRRRKTRFE